MRNGEEGGEEWGGGGIGWGGGEEWGRRRDWVGGGGEEWGRMRDWVGGRGLMRKGSGKIGEVGHRPQRERNTWQQN